MHNLPLMKSKSIAILLFSVIIFAIFIYGMYWLWQRQPKGAKEESQPTQSNQVQNPSAEKAKVQSNLKPQDYSILTSAKTTFSGTVTPSSIVVIYSNSIQATTKSDDKGNFQKDITLSSGLNLFNISVFSQNLEEKDKKTLTLYLAKDKEVSGNTVYAGSVKSIFNNLITLTTTNGDKNVSSQKSTGFTFPKNVSDNSEATNSAISNVRVGDYMVAIGKPEETDKITAQKITIIRDNKPQNSELISTIKLLTAPRQNLFSAKNEKDGKIMEFTLNKDSSIEVNYQVAKSTDIAKDKRAIVVSYTDKGDQIVDLISLIP